ncbi:hypothetical protein DYB32_000611 [Aphanomyces invadans]|uniref:GOST seven transmembrane domain-containing protein n=1 Tax=Aphanomyces invadans TaxID=157072 RepID=A0A418B9C9_9STRA|nr:hypothetical protein DYB32_000611 [Aphanomyces invadans]
MFANAPGAITSIVRVDFNATPVDAADIPSDMEFAVAVSIFDVAEGSVPPMDYCAENYAESDHGHVVGRVFTNSTALDVHGSKQFAVQHTGAQVVVVTTCMRPKFTFDDNSTLDMFPFQEYQGDVVYSIAASMSFLNSYGYLPGLMWGLLPFSAVLVVAYVSAVSVFAGLYWCHRSSLLRLHSFMLVVLVLMTVESLLWCITYFGLNATGQALCCPYPPMVLVATAFKVLSKLVARVLTTILCLGYGLARPHLTISETVVVTGLSLCYVVSTGVLEVVHVSNQAKGSAEPPFIWELLAVATDCCFAGWIFSSLMVTRRTLRATRQTSKLRMYNLLFGVLLAFVAFAFALTLLENAVYAKQVPTFSWEYLWLLWAASRVLTLALVVTLSVLWRPKQTSVLIAHSHQLPSCEDGSIDQAVQIQSEVDEIILEDDVAGDTAAASDRSKESRSGGGANDDGRKAVDAA